VHNFDFPHPKSCQAFFWGFYGESSYINLIISMLNGCSTIPDKPYHSVCEGKASCSDTELNSAISYRNDVLIGPNGWNACLVDKNHELKGCKELISRTRCKENDLNGNVLTPYYQAWLEYSETGQQHDHNQLDAILKWIKSTKGSLQVVVYIHGWHHNADISDGDPRNNAIKFPFLMARSVDTLKRLEIAGKIAMPTVLGIYVGWRGEEYTYQPASLLSIDGRSKAADRIGQAGILKNDLLAISNAVQQQSGNNGRIMVLGHSLGGRMLTSMYKSDLQSGNSAPLGKNSLVVTLNPAVGADCYDGVFEYMGHNPQGQRPYWMNITSENDSATGWIYKDGGRLGLIDSCAPDSEAAGVAIGHYRPYLRQVIDQSHEVNKNNSPRCVGSYFSNECQAYESSWFSTPNSRFLVGFPDRNQVNTKGGNTEFYELNFDLENSDVPKAALSREVWNVRSDETMIDFGDAGGGGVSGHHNGYISTVLMRLLTEVLYSDKI